MDVRIERTSGLACRCASGRETRTRNPRTLSSDKNTKYTRSGQGANTQRCEGGGRDRPNDTCIARNGNFRPRPRSRIPIFTLCSADFARISPCLDPNARSREVEVTFESRYRERAREAGGAEERVAHAIFATRLDIARALPVVSSAARYSATYRVRTVAVKAAKIR